MTLNEMKQYFFDEATELGLATEVEIERLCVWLENNGYDSDLAHRLWHDASEEIACMLADLAL